MSDEQMLDEQPCFYVYADGEICGGPLGEHIPWDGQGSVPSKGWWHEPVPGIRCPKCGGKERGVRHPEGGWTTCPRCGGRRFVAVEAAS